MSEAVVVPVVTETPVTSTAPAEGIQTDATPADSAPAAADQTPAGPTEDTPEKAGQARFQKQINKATRKFYEQKARADLLEKRVSELTPRTPQDTGAPKISDFTDAEEYATAKAEHAKTQLIRDAQQRHVDETNRQVSERLTASWNEKSTRGSEKYDDFDETVGEITPNSAFTAAIMDAENSDEVAYNLGKHPAEAKRIATLPPLSAIREIGKLEAKIALEPAQPRTPSNAPAPIRPVSATATPATKKLSELSQDEFEKRRRAQIAARR